MNNLRRQTATMHYSLSGNPLGPTVLLLHALGTSAAMWDAVVMELKADYYCIAVDLPGHGSSARIPWSSLAEVSLDLSEIIKKESPGAKAHVVGLSFGAYVGLELVCRYPLCVHGAMLSGLNVLPLPVRVLMKGLGWLISKLIKCDWMIRWNGSMLKINQQDMAAYRKSIKALNPGAYLRANNEAIDFRMPSQCAGVEVPLLLLAGENEHRLVIGSLKALQRNFSNASAFTLRKLGHAWSAEDPGLFARTLRNWIGGEELPVALLPISGSEYGR